MKHSDAEALKSTPPSIPGRIAGALTSRHWSLVAIELLLIVAGIMVALSIDDWVQDHENQRTERVYLGLLSRDLDQMAESLQRYIDTESHMAMASSTVIRKLSDDGYKIEAELLRGYLSDMGMRRTLQLVSATYTDLTSTGNLHLIRSQSLRDQLLRYFADVSRTQLVIEKNNTAFIDNMLLVIYDQCRNHLGPHQLEKYGSSAEPIPGLL